MSMEYDYFDDGEVAVQNQEYSSKKFQQPNNQGAQDNADEDFDFEQPAQTGTSKNQYIPSNYEDESTQKLRQEQDRIQERLREKANQQYEEKQKRKENGRKQLEEFTDKKEEEASERKRQNIQKEKRTREQINKLNEDAGWRKVGANILLKQGEQTGKKDVNRMREAILNKRSDEAS